MTIAIGVLCCTGNVVVAADTMVSRPDGSKTEANKVEWATGSSGAYVIANATNDGNATTTLVRQLLTRLKSDNYSAFSEVETAVVEVMTQWSAPHYQLPEIDLIFGATLDNDPEHDYARLYYCQPPNTILRKTTLHDDSYTSGGCGGRVSDPLWKILFSSSAFSPHKALMSIAYLMYRTKEDDTNCGGGTTAIVLSRNKEPQVITPLDMRQAERLGKSIDVLLRGTCAAVIGQSDDSARDYCSKFGQMIFDIGTEVRQFHFHTQEGDIIQ